MHTLPSHSDLFRFANQPVAVLFSGGDAPGMNAFLRAITRISLNQHNIPILGVRDGYSGLVAATQQFEKDPTGFRAQIERYTGRLGLLQEHQQTPQQLVFMDNHCVTGIVGDGGIILGSARCKEFREEDMRKRVLAMLEKLGIRALIVVGGDGSLAGAKKLTEEGNLRVIGVPATIDNDLEFTEMALGVDTAVGTLVWAVDHFKDTARSHRRVMVLETMGARSGELARMSAIASGAEVVVTPNPNKPLTKEGMDILAASIEVGFDAGRSHTIVLIAEGVDFEPEEYWDDAKANKRNRAYVLADAFKAYFQRPGGRYADMEIRPSVLGHLQRGGHTTPADCILAARFAEAAMDEITRPGGGNGVTAQRAGAVRVVGFDSPAPSDSRQRSSDYLKLHRALSSWTPFDGE